MNFDFDWKFFNGDPKGAEKTDYSDSKWKDVTLPSDWSIEGPYNKNNPSCQGYLPGGVAWYRKSFGLPEADRGKKISIMFDGVYENSEVWINGHFLGRRPYGYIPFRYDLSPYLKFGEDKNVLAVRVDHSQDADSRWYSGSGIYRDVWLVITNQVHIKQWGTLVTTPTISSNAATVLEKSSVRNETTRDNGVTLLTTILDENKQIVATSETSHEVPQKGECEFRQTLTVRDPRLWSPATPYVYTAVNRLESGGHIVDEYKTPFGIREIHFDADSGFSINGHYVKLKGVCLHEDAGELRGTAVPSSVWELRFKLLKEMGANAVRTSHNPPGPEFLNLCDRMGFLVIEEAFDEWELGKKKWLKGWNVGKSELSKGLGIYYDLYGYHEHFNKWAVRDLSDMIRQDRNHPSVILWSIGNEIDSPNDPYADSNDRYYESWRPSAKEIVPIAEKLAKTVVSLDTTRPVTAASANIPQSDATGFGNLFRIVGYNYMDAYYKRDHVEYPQRVIFASETGQSLREWNDVRDLPYVAGQFLWTGVDYLGEAGKWPNRCAGYGLIDLAGFRKPGYYFRQSLWSDRPVVHISIRTTSGFYVRNDLVDSWNWPDGKKVTVICFTNCRSAELFLNGKSLGVKVRTDLSNPTLTWEVDYQPGTLKVVGDDGGGGAVTGELHTSGAPYKVVLQPIQDSMEAGNGNVSLVKVFIEDKNGFVVPDDDSVITFDVSGEGKILGIENGNDNDVNSYSSNQHDVYHGRCMVAVKSTGHAGKIVLTATSSKTKKGIAVIHAR